MARRNETSTNSKAPRIVGLVFLFFGLVFGGFGLSWVLDTQAFMEGAVHSEATVASVTVNSSSDSTTYRPNLTFTDTSGALRKARTHISSSGYDYRVGEKVWIYHNFGHDSDVRIDGPFSIWGFAVIFSAFGALFFLIGASILKVSSGAKRIKRAIPGPERTRTARNATSPIKPAHPNASIRKNNPAVRRNR